MLMAAEAMAPEIDYGKLNYKSFPMNLAYQCMCHTSLLAQVNGIKLNIECLVLSQRTGEAGH
jgi:hypothetical protein